MRLLTTTLLIALSTAAALPAVSAQDLRAVTEDGRKVVLTPDGRWKFDSRAAATPVSLESTSPYQTAVKKFSVSFDSSSWVLVPRRDSDEVNKRQFRHKSLPLHAIVMADEIPARTEALRNIILSNAQSAGAATTVLLEQSREVAGKDVGSIRFVAAMNGLEFVFSSYYYGDSDGNIQVMCYTAQSLFFKYEGQCQQFLAGLVIK